MGAKPLFSLRSTRPRPPIDKAAKALAGILALALASCISDGANRTGGEYLAQHGVLLRDPLYHLVLKDIPVDSLWSTDADAEPSHLGDSTILVGRSGDFTAECRFEFHISDTAMLKKMDGVNAATFKLSLGLPPWRAGLSGLRASVATDTAHPIDSIPFEVRTWEIDNRGLSDAQWADTIAVWSRRYLVRNDTLALLDTTRMVRDTLYLKYDSAYTRNTPQAKQLVNLFRRLAPKRALKHLLEMQLVRISKSSADTAAGILRLGGFTGNAESELVYGPLLLFGAIDSSIGTHAADRLRVRVQANGSAGVNYNLRYSGSKYDIVTCKQRGLHLSLDRKTLLDSIDAELGRQGYRPQPRTASGEYVLALGHGPHAPGRRLSLDYRHQDRH
jgi:hypothetical protein